MVDFEGEDLVRGVGKGTTQIWLRVPGTDIVSDKIKVEAWTVDHVLLTPRTLTIPLGRRKRIVAEVTNDDGERATDIFLNWDHDADDPLIVRIHPSGLVVGNRLGHTSVSAGTGDPYGDGVWSKIRAEVDVIVNSDKIEQGNGFPQLLLTGRDIDPATGEIREGDPEQPALWQEPIDFVNNIWWLNLENPASLFHFQRRTEQPELWRAFHSQMVFNLVIQVHMQDEYSSRGMDERKDQWVSHKAALERYEVRFARSRRGTGWMATF